MAQRRIHHDWPPTRFDAKTIAAIAALVTALAGGVEMRVQVGLLRADADQLKRDVAELRAERFASR